MKPTTRVRYAVMAMVDLAERCDGKDVSESCAVTLAEIAACQDISLAYLEQLFGCLRRAGLVESVRGPGGGYRLARGPEDIRLSDILWAVGESLQATRCENGQASGCRQDRARCNTHDLWAELGNHIYLFFRALSLADVVRQRVLGISGRLNDPDVPRQASL